MIKFGNRPTLLSVMLYHYIASKSMAPNGWTEIAHWLELPSHFTAPKKPKPYILPELLAEIIWHRVATDSVGSLQVVERVSFIAHCITTEQQQELLDFLYTKQQSLEIELYLTDIGDLHEL